MSRDWGYGCRTCDESETIEGMRYVEDLREALLHPSLLAAVRTVAAEGRFFLGGLQVVEHSCNPRCNLEATLCFAAKHLALGHEVDVIDEYGFWWNQCRKLAHATADCVLTAGHAGCCTCGSAQCPKCA